MTLHGKLLTDLDLMAIDTETTGFGPEARLVEIGVCRFRLDRPGAFVESWLIDPGMPIPPKATEIHGITDEMVAGQPDTGAGLARLGGILSVPPDVILGHNFRAFDLPILLQEGKRVGLEVGGYPPGIDTLLLARHLNGRAGNTLQDLAVRYQIPLAGGVIHRAGHDALAVALVFRKLIEAHSSRFRTWEDLEAAGCIVPGRGC